LTIERAIAVYRHRGKIVEQDDSDTFAFPWSTKVHHGFYHYSINREHPLVSDIIKNSGDRKKQIEALLSLIEETVPVPLIILNESQNPDKIKQPFEGTPSDELRMVIKEVYDSMTNSGISKHDAEMRLSHMKPFSDYPKFVTEFIQKMKLEE